MFDSPEDLKEFIIWAKSMKVKRVKVDNIEIELSDLALIEDIQPPLSQDAPTEQQPQSEADKKEDEELLFWSTSN